MKPLDWARCAGFGLAVVVASVAMNASTQRAGAGYHLVDIDGIGDARLSLVKSLPGVHWWVEAGRQLLVFADDGAVGRSGLQVKKLAIAANLQRLFVVQRGHMQNLAGVEADLLVAGGRKMLLQAWTDAVPVLPDPHKHDSVGASNASHARLTLFRPNQVFARQDANQPIDPNKGAKRWKSAVSRRLAALESERWFEDVEYLASLNRHSFNGEIETARDWFAAELEEQGLEVRLQEFELSGRTLHNVIAKVTGTSRPDEVYIVGGHYDSTSENSRVAAPGAEDNGTGAAGVLEMARIFAAEPPEATIYFIGFSGEEQGLHGSKAHVTELLSAGTAEMVKGVINMDMIGYSQDGEDVAVLLETERVASELLGVLQSVAAEFCDMEVFTSFDAFGSDHVPYLDQDIPAVLTIDNDYPTYPSYHRTTDTPDKVVRKMGVEILKMNVAAISELAG